MSFPRSPEAPRHRGGGNGDRGWFGDQTQLADFVGLLEVMGCETTAELDLILYSAFDLDPCIAEAGPRHVVVAVGDRGAEVRFPCTLQEFWDSASRLEKEVRQHLEDGPDDA